MKKNIEIRQRLQREDITFRDIARVLGYNHCTISRWFQKELTGERREQVENAILSLEAGRDYILNKDYAVDPQIDFGEFLRVMRKYYGKSQYELAEDLGVKQGTISSWETNKTYPPIDLAKDIIQSFGGELQIVAKLV